MPKYEYACKSCGEHIDVVQSFTDDALTECPTCGGRLRKVFGSVGIVLKGPGFYRNDHRSPPRSEGSKLAMHDKDRDKDKAAEKAEKAESSAGSASSDSSGGSGGSGGSDGDSSRSSDSSSSTGSSSSPSSSSSSSSSSSPSTDRGPKDTAKTA